MQLIDAKKEELLTFFENSKLFSKNETLKKIVETFVPILAQSYGIRSRQREINDAGEQIPAANHSISVAKLMLRAYEKLQGNPAIQNLAAPKVLLAASLLHDLQEDGKMSFDEIEKFLRKTEFFFAEEITQILEILEKISRKKTENSEESTPNYLGRIAENPNAIFIKFHDVVNNSLSSQSKKQKKKMPHYINFFSTPDRKFLMGTLAFLEHLKIIKNNTHIGEFMKNLDTYNLPKKNKKILKKIQTDFQKKVRECSNSKS